MYILTKDNVLVQIPSELELLLTNSDKHLYESNAIFAFDVNMKMPVTKGSNVTTVIHYSHIQNSV